MPQEHVVSIDPSKPLSEEPGTGHNRWHEDIEPVVEVDPGDTGRERILLLGTWVNKPRNSSEIHCRQLSYPSSNQPAKSRSVDERWPIQCM